MSYKLLPLSEVTSLIKDGTHGTHERVKSGIPLLSAKDIESGGIKISRATPRITDKEYSKIHKNYSIKKNDLLLTIVGTLGRCALVKDEQGKFSVQRSVAIIRGNKDLIDPKFLYFVASSSDFYRQLLLRSQSTAQAGVYLGELAKCTIPFPLLTKQKSIVKILSYCDKLINKLEKQKSIQKNILIGLISDFFLSKDNTIPKVKIGEICKVKRGASPRPIQSTKWWGKGRGWTRIADVTNSHKYLFKTKDHLSQEGEQKSIPIDPGDLILSICATIGLPIIVKTPICIHDGFVWFEGLKESLEVEYAYYFFSAVRNQLLQGSQTGTQGNLNTSIVSNIEIPLRSIDTQRRITSILSSTDNNISMTSKKIDKYKNLKRSLLDNLVSGSKRANV